MWMMRLCVCSMYKGVGLRTEKKRFGRVYIQRIGTENELYRVYVPASKSDKV